MANESVTAVATVATAAVAAIAAWFSLREYRRSGRWKAAELAAARLHLLGTDEALAFCCQALDWGTAMLVVPTKFRPLVGTDVIEHDVNVLVTAMEPQLTQATIADPRGILYRRSFDEFFGFLESAQEMLDLKLVQPVHFSGLRYWLQKLARWDYAPNPADRHLAFLPFLVACEYGRVLRLFDSLGVSASYQAEDEARVATLKAESRPFGKTSVNLL